MCVCVFIHHSAPWIYCSFAIVVEWALDILCVQYLFYWTRDEWRHLLHKEPHVRKELVRLGHIVFVQATALDLDQCVYGNRHKMNICSSADYTPFFFNFVPFCCLLILVYYYCLFGRWIRHSTTILVYPPQFERHTLSSGWQILYLYTSIQIQFARGNFYDFLSVMS